MGTGSALAYRCGITPWERYPRAATTACTPANSCAAGGRGRHRQHPPRHHGRHPRRVRFQQTMKKWLRAQPHQPATIAELQTLLETFREEYNHRRPHRSLEHRSTPATAYSARPKATPGGVQNTETHDRVRRDKINKAGTVTLRVAGRLRHIGVGRPHAGTHVYLLIQDLDVRVVDAATGELLRELTINPSKDYQPRNPQKPNS